MYLRNVDLNLLLVFDALMEERHVTRARQRIGLTRPAMGGARREQGRKAARTTYNQGRQG